MWRRRDWGRATYPRRRGSSTSSVGPQEGWTPVTNLGAQPRRDHSGPNCSSSVVFLAVRERPPLDRYASIRRLGQLPVDIPADKVFHSNAGQRLRGERPAVGPPAPQERARPPGPPALGGFLCVAAHVSLTIRDRRPILAGSPFGPHHMECIVRLTDFRRTSEEAFV